MSRLKVLSKNDSISLLKEGHKIQYDTLAGKAYIVNKENDRLGAVRFDTYINSLLNITKSEPTKYYSHLEYRVLK